MKLFSIRIVFDRKGETKNNPKKEALVQIEILDKGMRKKKYISTGIKLFANQYSAVGGFSVKNHLNAIIVKTKVFEIYNKIEAFVHSDKCTCIDDVDNWNAESKSKLTFLEFFEQDMYKKPIKAGMLKTHKTLLLGLVRFGRIVQFKDITYPNIADFDVFLRQTLKSQPILYKRHNTLNSFIKEAKRRKLITDNPYEEFKIKKRKS